MTKEGFSGIIFEIPLQEFQVRASPTNLSKMTPEEVVIHKRKVAKLWREKNRDRIRENSRRCYQKTKESYLARQKNWQKRNPDKVLAIQRKYVAKRRQMAIEALGNMCQRCGEKDIVVLTIDHIGGDGYVERKASGSVKGMYSRIINNPDESRKKYQVLCWNCQFRKKIENGEVGNRKSWTKPDDYGRYDERSVE